MKKETQARAGEGARDGNSLDLRFEEAMAQLEDVVRKLEAGDVPLEDSLAAFEKGVNLVRVLHARLDAVHEKIEELTRTEKGEPVVKPFDPEQ
jgi:exodeoxyribonuclease VII small subunit